jgi:Protein of unknown function (DUF3500)
MKRLRAVLAFVVMAALAGVAYDRQREAPAGSGMAAAAANFLATLTAEQKAKAVFLFDSKERLAWHFVPLQTKDRQPSRKGLRLEEMNPKQSEAARHLLRAGTSESGFRDATTIMTLEEILRDTEKSKANVRNPGWYFFTVFGEPGKGRWGWRVEGHHLSLNFVVDGGKVVSSTPAFFGANPATVKDGPRAGERTLNDADDLARGLVKRLDEDQKKVAIQAMQFPEIGGGKRDPEVGEPRGLAAARMNAEQRAQLQKLLRAYTRRMPADVAEAEWAELQKAGFEKIHFAYAGDTEPGKPHSYRIQGPTFVVEFLNIQADGSGNPANHIHSAWRRIHGDFALGE